MHNRAPPCGRFDKVFGFFIREKNIGIGDIMPNIQSLVDELLPEYYFIDKI